MTFNGLNRKRVKYGYACGRCQWLRRYLMGHIAKLAGCYLKLATKDADIPRRVESDGYPIARNSADLQDDVVPDVNPFADFSTEHQHDLKLLCSSSNSVKSG